MILFLVPLLYAIWSSCFSLGKLAVQCASPVFITGIRMTIAGFLLLGFLYLKNKKSFNFSIKKYISLAILGFFSVYLTNICEYWGLQHLSAAKTCFIYSLSPFFAMLFSYIHFKEKLNLRKCLGILIGFIGFIPVLKMQSGSEHLFSMGFSISLADLSIMGAALFSVYGWVLLRVFVKNDISPPMANGISMAFGGILALGHSLMTDTWNPLPIAHGQYSPFFLGLTTSIFVYSILCYNFYGYLLKRFTATFLSFAGLLSPIFASLNAWLILGEPLSPVIFVSTGIVSLGLWLIYQAELKQGYILLKPSNNSKIETT